MAFNIKPILKEKADKRPKNLFEYILYYNGTVAGSDDVIMYPILSLTNLNIDVKLMLAEYDWFTFITTLTTDFPLPLGDSYNTYTESNVVNDYIFSNYAFYDLLPKITDLFTYDNFTINDRNYMRSFIDGIVGNVLVKNAEKYKKLYDAMTVAFNPLWNVDGTETTTRTLERDGTETTAHDGTDTATKTFDNTDTLTFDTDDKTTYNSGNRIEYDTDDTTTYASTDTTTYNTTDTTTYNNVTNSKNGEETRTVDVDKAAFNSNVKQPIETTTDNLQYNSFSDVKSGSESLAKTGTDTTAKTGHDTLAKTGDETATKSGFDTYEKNGSETNDHSGTITDATEYDSNSTLTLDTVDTEHISVVRQGNIGVTTTTKLLTEYVDFAEYVDFIKTISHDIVSELCYLA